MTNIELRDKVNLLSQTGNKDELDLNRAALLGLYYKIPTCCIYQFCKDLSQQKWPGQLRGNTDHGYIPCDACISTTPTELVSIEKNEVEFVTWYGIFSIPFDEFDSVFFSEVKELDLSEKFILFGELRKVMGVTFDSDGHCKVQMDYMVFSDDSGAKESKTKTEYVDAIYTIEEFEKYLESEHNVTIDEEDTDTLTLLPLDSDSIENETLDLSTFPSNRVDESSSLDEKGGAFSINFQKLADIMKNDLNLVRESVLKIGNLIDKFDASKVDTVFENLKDFTNVSEDQLSDTVSNKKLLEKQLKKMHIAIKDYTLTIAETKDQSRKERGEKQLKRMKGMYSLLLRKYNLLK